MNEYTVRVAGEVVGTRKSARVYTHALVVDQKQHDGSYARNRVEGFAGSLALANKAAAALVERGRKYGRVSNVRVCAVEARSIARRERVRCQGLQLETHETRAYGQVSTWSRAVQCRKDATNVQPEYVPTCDEHKGADNARVRAAAQASQEACRVREWAAWEARHAAEFTMVTCRLSACSVHAEGAVR